MFKDDYSPDCPVKWENWAGSYAYDFKTDENPKNVLNSFWLTYAAENQVMTIGSNKNQDTYTIKDSTISNENINGELKENGEI